MINNPHSFCVGIYMKKTILILSVCASSAFAASPSFGPGGQWTSGTFSAATLTGTTSAATLSVSGTTSAATLNISGSTSANGNTTLGDASGDTLTINAGTVTAPNATGTSSTSISNLATLDTRYGGPMVFAVAASSLSRASTVTLADDPELTIVIPSSGVWQINILVRLSSTGGGSRWKWDASVDNLTTKLGSKLQSVPGAPAALFYIQSSILDTEYTAAAGNNEALTLIISGLSGQTIVLQWAQSTSNAGNTTREAGSFIMARKLQ